MSDMLQIMIVTFQALSVFLIFFPGFLSQRIIELLTPRRPRNNFERLIDAAALSLVIYGLYLGFAQLFGLPDMPVLVPTNGVVHTGNVVDLVHKEAVALILGLSVVGTFSDFYGLTTCLRYVGMRLVYGLGLEISGVSYSSLPTVRVATRSGRILYPFKQIQL